MAQREWRRSLSISSNAMRVCRDSSDMAEMGLMIKTENTCRELGVMKEA